MALAIIDGGSISPSRTDILDGGSPKPPRKPIRMSIIDGN